MVFPHRREHYFARTQDARLERHGKVNPSKVRGKSLILGYTSSFQTGAKYLKTGKQIPGDL